MQAALLMMLALAAQTKTVEEEVALLLSAHHQLPARAVFEREVPGAKEVLMSLALRTELFRAHRDRAIEALAMWPDADVKEVYLGLLQDAATPAPTKHRILLLVPRVFGEETPRILQPWLAHSDARIRRTAEIALRRSESRPAR